MKKKQQPSQHEITVRDRRSLNKKILALTARVEKLEEAQRRVVG